MAQLACLEISHRQIMRTPYGEPSGPLTFGKINDNEVVFLPRHGSGHTIPPHEVNYRANLWALQSLKLSRVISVASVGGIREDLAPGKKIIFAACGVTPGNLLQGVRFFGDGYRTHSLVMTLSPNNVSFRDTVHMTSKPGPRGVRLY